LDSKLVVEQMSGRWAIKNEALRRIALRARDVFPRAQVTYTWVPREQNKLADALANESMDAVERGLDGSVRRSRTDAYETETEADAVPPGARPTPAVVGWGPDIGPPTVTVLVRHGVTQHSLERRFSGSGGDADPPLVEQGVAQAHAAAEELVRRGGADVLVCSPMVRTRQTAAVIGERLGLEAEVVEGLEECRFGAWDGHTFAEVTSGWPDEMTAWLASPDVAPPGGESLSDLARRVSAALDGVLARHAGARILLVAHVGTIRALTARALLTPALSMNRMELAPASITTLTWYADGNASMRSFAESSHLQQLATTWTP
jgi:probable phosphoglycerate mutase